jgi:hypothetical protein
MFCCCPFQATSDIDEILKRIGCYKGVIGTIVVNSEGDDYWLASCSSVGAGPLFRDLLID